MQLSETWFVEGRVDFEMQKYRLLAYLRDVDALFGKQELYPQLSDVIFHHNNLMAFRNNKQFLQDAFPRRMSELNLQQAALIYERMLKDDELMQELEDITAYALQRIRKTIDQGTDIYEEVAHTMEVYPVGLLPVYKDQGYLLLRWGSHQETRAYSYSVSLFEHGNAQYRGLKMTYLNSWEHSLMYTPQHIKAELTRQGSSMDSPAFFALETSLELPLQATILPVARRVFIRYLSAQA